MRTIASTDQEVMLREINETEQVLAIVSDQLGCICLIDPTETLATRVALLGKIAGRMFEAMEHVAKGNRDAIMYAAHADFHIDNLDQEN